MNNKLHTSLEWLKLRYQKQRKSIAEMATEAQVDEKTIRRALQDKGLIFKR